MIKARFYCKKCLLRMEAEVVYDKRQDKNIYAYSGMDAENSFPVCPACHAQLQHFKIVRDVPDRYIDEEGRVCIKEYKDL